MDSGVETKNQVTPEVIRATNDFIRKTIWLHLGKTMTLNNVLSEEGWPISYRAIWTPLIDEVRKNNPDRFNEIISAVETYDRFEDNDTYGEHDFGAFDSQDEKVFWKFDYYDQNYEYFCANGNRVLTIMFAEEY